jgi:hypothetical protein
MAARSPAVHRRQNPGLQDDYDQQCYRHDAGECADRRSERRASRGDDTRWDPNRGHHARAGAWALCDGDDRVAGSNIDFGGTEVKVIQAKDLPMGSRPQPAFTCDGMFVPME